jgi:hypothetical protein
MTGVPSRALMSSRTGVPSDAGEVVPAELVAQVADGGDDVVEHRVPSLAKVGMAVHSAEQGAVGMHSRGTEIGPAEINADGVEHCRSHEASS